MPSTLYTGVSNKGTSVFSSSVSLSRNTQVNHNQCLVTIRRFLVSKLSYNQTKGESLQSGSETTRWTIRLREGISRGSVRELNRPRTHSFCLFPRNRTRLQRRFMCFTKFMTYLASMSCKISEVHTFGITASGL